MPKHTYQIEVDTENGWRPMTGVPTGLEYGRGYIGCHRESSGPRIGLRLVRPVARRTDQTYVFEVTRLVTDGGANVCSFLYTRAAAAAKAMGARSIQTFTLPAEGGASLRASGWTEEATITPPENGWNSREHANDLPLFGVQSVTVQGPKVRWRRTFAA